MEVKDLHLEGTQLKFLFQGAYGKTHPIGAFWPSFSLNEFTVADRVFRISRSSLSQFWRVYLFTSRDYSSYPCTSSVWFRTRFNTRFLLPSSLCKTGVIWVFRSWAINVLCSYQIFKALGEVGATVYKCCSFTTKWKDILFWCHLKAKHAELWDVGRMAYPNQVLSISTIWQNV